MNDMQKQFEEWAGFSGYDLNVIDADYTLYANIHTEIAWQAWKASRVFLVVAMPDICDLHPRKMLESEVGKALNKAGVSYK